MVGWRGFVGQGRAGKVFLPLGRGWSAYHSVLGQREVEATFLKGLLGLAGNCFFLWWKRMLFSCEDVPTQNGDEWGEIEDEAPAGREKSGGRRWWVGGLAQARYWFLPSQEQELGGVDTYVCFMWWRIAGVGIWVNGQNVTFGGRRCGCGDMCWLRGEEWAPAYAGVWATSLR